MILSNNKEFCRKMSKIENTIANNTIVENAVEENTTEENIVIENEVEETNTVVADDKNDSK